MVAFQYCTAENVCETQQGLPGQLRDCKEVLGNLTKRALEFAYSNLYLLSNRITSDHYCSSFYREETQFPVSSCFVLVECWKGSKEGEQKKSRR